ncbi:hypothetical protein MMAN_54080 [Mycobacterium mantenii]|uniref:Uncharacterized protein n=1 Tax=Mycobacterium mantenii TaxID=560555 RepID=A0ABN6AKD7_MYCNT|nr:hypothetical protein MMAN_54080 [Mycobacterium mantenii]
MAYQEIARGARILVDARSRRTLDIWLIAGGWPCRRAAVARQAPMTRPAMAKRSQIPKRRLTFELRREVAGASDRRGLRFRRRPARAGVAQTGLSFRRLPE